MTFIWLTTALISIAVAGAVLALVRKLSRGSKPVFDADWLARIAVDRYRPMGRLLDPAEEAFLAGHADRRTVRHFRAQRRRIFRAYLNSMERDFGRICAAIRIILVHSEHDRPELAGALIRRQAMFALAVWSVRCRLYMHAAGIGTVDIRSLVGALDSMRAELGQLIPLPAASAA